MAETSIRSDDSVVEYLRAVEECGDNVPFWMSTERPRRGVIVVSVFGDLDMVSVGRFSRLVQQRVDSVAGVIVLDLTGVTFLGVEAIKVLAQLDLRAHLADKRLSLVTGVRTVDRPLEALGLADRFTYGSRPVFEPGSVDRNVSRAHRRWQETPAPRQRRDEYDTVMSR